MIFIFDLFFIFIFMFFMVGFVSLGFLSLFFIPFLFLVIFLFTMLVTSSIFYWLMLLVLFILIANIFYKLVDKYIKNINNKQLTKVVISILLIILFLFSISSNLFKSETSINYKKTIIENSKEGVSI